MILDAPEPRRSRFAGSFVFWSLAFHVGAFLLILGAPRLLALSPRQGPVYVVDLVTALPGGAAGPPGPQSAAPPAPPAPAAKPPAPKPKEKPKETVKPPPKKPAEKSIVLPEKGAKKTPEKPKPKPETRPAETSNAAGGTADESATKETQKADASAATSPDAGKPAAAAGSGPGGTGTGGGGNGSGTGGGGDDYTFYLSLLDKNIRAAWNRPVSTATETRSSTVSLTLSRSGRVLKLWLKTASGFEPLDRSVLLAVRAAEPFPPFPTTLTNDTLTVQIQFDLTPEGTPPEN
jgi:protein TonB